MSKTYTRETLIELIINKNKELNKVPIVKDIKIPNCYMTYVKCFGSWNNALKTAGLNPKKENNKYSKDDLIKIIKDKAYKIGRTPTIDDIKTPGRTIFCYTFGSWNNALIESGFEPLQLRIPRSQNFKKMEKEHLTMLLSEWMVQHNYTLNNLEILKDKNMPSPSFIMKKLCVDKWNDVIKLVCKYSKFKIKKTFTDEELEENDNDNNIIKIIKKIHKNKGIRKERKAKFEADEKIVNYLKKNYSNKFNKVLAEELNVPIREINRIASYFKLKKSKTFIKNIHKYNKNNVSN